MASSSHPEKADCTLTNSSRVFLTPLQRVPTGTMWIWPWVPCGYSYTILPPRNAEIPHRALASLGSS